MGIRALRRIQLGRETTAGTAVAATTIWRGLGVLDDQRETVFPDEHVGILMPVDRSYVPKLAGEIELESVPASFEQILHVLEAGVKTVTPAQDSAGSGYVYTYPFPTTAQNAVKTYTIEGGDDEQAEEMEYAFVTEFTLEGNAGEAVMLTSTWTGRQVANTTFTSPLSLPIVEETLFQKGKLYIDDVDGTAGTTQAANTFLSFSLSVKTGQQAVFTGDGNLYFSFRKQVAPEIMLDVTFEHDSVAVAEKAAHRNQTPRLIRLLFEGSTLTTAGDYTNKSLIIDLPGKWQSFDPIGEQDGNDILKGTFKVSYDPTYGASGQIIVVNELSSVP